MKSIEAVLALLENQVFCDEALRLKKKIVEFVASSPLDDQRDEFVSQLTTIFIEKWGVSPPQAGALVDPDPARPYAEAVMSGRWGVVPIFGWTNEQEIRTAIRNIRRIVRKQHQDAENARRAQLARWLEDCGFSRPDIAAAVWGRRGGLRRPSKEQAFDRLPEHVERKWVREYLARGHTSGKVERLVNKRARGSEAPASAAVRMSEHRYEQEVEQLNIALASPVAAEPVSAALTRLYRADERDHAEIGRGLVELRRALVPSTIS